MMKTTLATALLLTTSALTAQATTLPDEFTSFYVLGDSLSDDGNLPELIWNFALGGAPYAFDPNGAGDDAGGKISNGAVWNEGIQGQFVDAGLDADNFAVADAEVLQDKPVPFFTIPSLMTQVDQLLADSANKGDRPLVALWMGANDLLEGFGNPGFDTLIDNVVGKIGDEIGRMFDNGFSDFAVFDLPDTAKFPSVSLFDPTRAPAATFASLSFNAALAEELAAIETDALNIIDIDMFEIFDTVFENAADLGSPETMLPCVFPNEAIAAIFFQPERCSDTTGGLADERLFVDSLHPNTIAHGEIGRLVEERILNDGIAPIPLPLPAGMLLGALGLLGLVSRRKA